MERRNMLAVIGFVGIIPALLICLSGLSGLNLNLPQILIHPLVILGGLALALAINALPITHLNAHLEDNNFVGSVTVRLKGSLMNFGVIVLSLALLATIAVYLFVENFQPR